MDNNSSRRFIFDESFYSNLKSNTADIEEKDPFAPIKEVEVKKEPLTVVEEKKEEEEKPIEPEVSKESKMIFPREVKIEKTVTHVIPAVKEETVMVNVEPEESETEVLNDDSNLNVKSGIDVKLEKEILRNIQKNQIPDEFEFPVYEEPTRTIYRATRRPTASTPVNNINTNTPSVEKPKEVVKEPVVKETIEEEEWVPPYQPQPITIKEEIKYFVEDTTEATKSDLLDKLKKQADETGEFSILARYGDDFCSHDYITNPAIGRENEIKSLGLILLMPEKSAILVGKPGIGKTSIVEGLAYRLQRNQVPDALKGFTIVSIKTASLLGKAPNGETKLQTLVDELKKLDKIILFIDEIHMLIEAQDDSNLDFANLFKESLGRGSIKMIGATTTEEYERYILRDKAFVRRFQRVDVNESTKEETVEIVLGSLPKIEKMTGAKFKYTHYIQAEIVRFIVDITSEYKRVYGIGSRYPDICLTLVTQAFSEAVFDNRNEVNIIDIRNAISKSKNIYPDVIKKELVNFDKEFKELIDEEV